jgi:hypothetical protein
MSAETLAASSNAFAQTFAEEITRTWNRVGILAQNLPVKSGGGQGGGKNVAWDVEMDGATAVDFAEGSDVAGGELDFDPVVPATLAWGQYRASFQISNLLVNAAAANAGNAQALEDIWKERVMNKAAKLLDRINSDIFTGTGTGAQGNPNIIGLQAALLGTGSYAGISKGTYPTWAGNVAANGGTARQLSMNLLSTAENLGFIASNSNISALVTSAGVRSKYEGMFEQVRRTVDDGKLVPAYEGSTKEYFWRGKPILRDRQNPTGQMFMLDWNEIELRVLPWAPFIGMRDGVPMFDEPIPSSNGTETGTTGIPVRVYPLGLTGSGAKFVLEIYVQLKVKRPNAHVWIQDISEV